MRDLPLLSLSFNSTSSRGHGTYVDNDEVIASVTGVIERVNKLITVRALQIGRASCRERVFLSV